MATKKPEPKETRTTAKIPAKAISAREPSAAARKQVAGQIHLPGGPGSEFCRTAAGDCYNCASNCGSNCSSDCGTNCSSDCGTNCSSDCGSNCASDCGSNCASDCQASCDCGSSLGRFNDIAQQLTNLESLMQVRFGDLEQIMERLTLNAATTNAKTMSAKKASAKKTSAKKMSAKKTKARR